MTTLEQKYPPRVEIRQTIESADPAPVTPVLLTCVVGPCYTIVDAMESGAINTNAIVNVPGYTMSLFSSPYTGLGGKSIAIKYKEYDPVNIDFPSTRPNPTADQVAETIASLPALTGVSAQAVTIDNLSYVIIYTTTIGDDEYFSLVTPTGTDGTSILGIRKDFAFHAYPTYDQYESSVPEYKFPDTMNVLSEATMDTSSVRAFLRTGASTLVEAKTDESMLSVFNEANVIGTVDLTGLSYPDDLFDETLKLRLGGESEKTLTFFQTLKSEMVTAYNEFAANYTNHISDIPNTYHVATDTSNVLMYSSLGMDSTVAELIAAYNDAIIVYNAHDADATVHTTDSLHQCGTGPINTLADLIAAYTTAVTGLAPLFGDHLASTGAGATHPAADSDNTLSNTINVVDENTIISDINGTWSGIASIMAMTNYLVLTTNSGGMAIGTGTGHTTIGLTAGNYFVLSAVDDGDGDNYTPILEIRDSNLSAAPTTAQVTGTVDLSTLSLPDDILEEKLHVSDGTHEQVIEFYPNMRAEVIAILNELLDSYTSHIGNISVHYVEDIANALTYSLVDGSSPLTGAGGLCDAINEFTAKFNDHDANTGGAYHTAGSGHQIPVVVANSWATAYTALLGIKTNFNAHIADVTGSPTYHAAADTVTITNSVTAPGTYQTDIITPINNVMGSGFASATAAHYLYLVSPDLGHESIITIGSGSSNTTLGLDAGITHGGPFNPVAGDQVWVDGALVGTIVQVMPNSNVSQVRIDREVALNYYGEGCYLRALNLSYGTVGRPTPDFYNDGYNYTLKHDLIRNGKGLALSTTAPVLISYKALRLDVTAEADKPYLLMFNGPTQLEQDLAPIDTRNPLAFGIYAAMLSAPNTAIAAIGVHTTSADYPEGTLEGYARALELLEGYGVYNLVPLTQESSVHTLFDTHVTAMSAATGMKERVCTVSLVKPERDVDTLVVSGYDGESTSVTNEFETGVAGLSMSLTELGLNPSSLTGQDGVYLSISSDAKKYNISEVIGSKVTIRTSFPLGGNEDGYFTDSNLPTGLIQENFSIFVKGAEITSRLEEAQTLNKMASSFSNRRVWPLVVPEAEIPIDGVQTLVKGYYVAAGYAAAASAINPSEPLTGITIGGFTKANYVSPYFIDKYLNHIAAGGGTILYTPEGAENLVVRHALTSDTTSLKTETPSFTMALDYGAIFLRRILINFKGKYKIGPNSLDMLCLFVSSGVKTLIESDIWLAADPGEPAVSVNKADQIDLKLKATIGMPGNVIAINLVA